MRPRPFESFFKRNGNRVLHYLSLSPDPNVLNQILTDLSRSGEKVVKVDYVPSAIDPSSPGDLLEGMYVVEVA
ncbi:MAG: hypothetical protein ACYCOU_22730 [Sulfobacillus sp.]